MFMGTKSLTYSYAPSTPYTVKALNEVSFSIDRGSFVLLIGSSGSGKTTLIQHFNGLLQPDSGEVHVFGRALAYSRQELAALRRRVGLVFQVPEEHFFSENIFDEVAFAPRNLGLEENKVEGRVVKALKRVGLEAPSILGRHPFQVSAGQKRRVALAAVLSLEPEVLILDEPTAGLDPAGRRLLFELLSALNRDDGLTVLVSTHHLDEAAALATQVLALHEGRVVLDGPPELVLCGREELEAIGMALPAVTRIMHDLHARGFPVNRAVFTLGEARSEIEGLKGPGSR